MKIEEIDKNMAVKAADENGLVWHMPYEKPFQLAGFYWFEQDKVYRRFPVEPQFPLSGAVEDLGVGPAFLDSDGSEEIGHILGDRVN